MERWNIINRSGTEQYQKMRRLIEVAVVLTMLMMMKSSLATSDEGLLQLDFYKETCPLAEEIIGRMVEIAVLKDPRMAASLLRLHFHDCFVLGCDASVLLDSHGDMISEKEAGPNLNSIRGFLVIDEIKSLLEEACPLTVSCADILAIVARDAVYTRGGPRWMVWLGRRDSLKASFDGANQFIPAPNSSLLGLISNFKQQGLDIQDLVALSGSHTIGKARCLSFKERIDQVNPIEVHSYDKYKRYNTFRKTLRSTCSDSGRDSELAPLDLKTPSRFDNHYYINLLEGKGLLGSDNVLVSEDEEGEIIKQVWSYASNQDLFFDSFVKSIVKMGNINVLTGHQGEIRKNCRLINNY
ncbi:peroxidase 20-like isoform X3 [Carica papaya]|uniref:peroxidase 20-like isoform X3 n=1 Tax=Carica papaya TaxID=3649 RepID=UPI000B8CB290|nr:peroxidase 20-like isoform X3 [Carica papaya]